jgi:hypothetical protein
MEELWRQVGAVRPRESPEVHVDLKCAKEGRIFERVKHRADERGSQVDFALTSILEPQPDDMSTYVASFEHVVVLVATPVAERA